MRGLGKIGLGILMFFVVATGSASAACSNSNADGVYGYAVYGFTGPNSPLAVVGYFTADGSGNISSGHYTRSDKGTVTTATFAGTYSIAKDCTGTVTTTDSNDVTNHYYVALSGPTLTSVDFIASDPGVTASGGAHSQGVGTCGLTGKPQTFAEHLLGYAGADVVAAVGRIGTDGKGNISFGDQATSNNGKNYKAEHISGTYTANSNCTGTAKIAYRGANYNYSYVTVDAGKEYFMIETDANTTVAGTLASQ